jgi:uncharacterized protein (DUF2252 family)
MTSKKSVGPDDRISVLRLRQTLKMARSAHAYVRGSTVKFYEWLQQQKRGTLPEGPPVWICGDCHAGNLGPVAGVDGRVAIQIRDLDQTVIGNPARDRFTRYTKQKMPKDQAERVVEGAMHLSPHLGKRMVAGKIEGKSVFIRELLPQDLKIELEQLSVPDAMKAASFLAGIVGKAHARQMDVAMRKSWSNELNRHRSKSLDAPSWLWSSVVALVGAQEIAYLEHCRKYATTAPP